MTKENIIASARIFAKLQTVLEKDNVTDVINAARNPVKMMVLYNKEARLQGTFWTRKHSGIFAKNTKSLRWKNLMRGLEKA